MESSIFTKIINGKIPCHKIYEDAQIIAFLDIAPLTPGHTLVIPKQQVSHFDDLDDELYASLFLVVKRVAQRIKQVTGAERACVRVEGFNVPHAHVHVYPCNTAQDFYGDKIRLHKEPDFIALAKMARKTRFLTWYITNMNLMVSFFAGAGVAAWVYSKIMHSSGGNTQNSLIVAGSAGVAGFVVMTIIMNMLPK